ncbi:MAG: hypothetical protein PHR52_10120 [Fermentimonas sp.]|jgi:hypothetical protein|nr:hypothetical protein [Fermentimonas sp.]
MRNLKKVSLFSPEGLGNKNVLTEEEMRAIIGGYVDGYCYFYCMEFLSGRYESGATDINGFMASYASTYGFSDLINGGISDMSRIQNFTGSNFGTSTVNISNMNAFLNGSTCILAGIKVNGNDHAVVITRYDSTSNKYYYYDPALSQETWKYASDFTFALGIIGSK